MKKQLWIALGVIVILVLLFKLIGCSSIITRGEETSTTTSTAMSTTGTLALTWSGTKQLGSPTGGNLLSDADGNIYVVGTIFSGLDGNTWQGGGDVFLMKFDPAGNKKWTKQTGTSGDDSDSGAARDSDGNIYIAGLTDGSFAGYSNAGGIDIFLLKYDSDGNKQWVKQFGTDSDEDATSVAVDSSGNVYLSGNTTAGFDGNAHIGSQDFFLMKFNSAGNKQWTKQFGTSKWDQCNGVITDPDGNIYLTGGVLLGGLYGNTNIGLSDAFLMKCDPDGDILWTKQFGSAATDVGLCLAVCNGYIYATGNTTGGMDGNSNSGSNDFYLAKYNSSGNQQWIKQFGTANSDDCGSVVVDSTGAVCLSGRIGTGPLKDGPSSLFLIKIGSDDKELWTKQFSPDQPPGGGSLVFDLHDNVYVSGGGPDVVFDGITGGYLMKLDSSGNKQ